MKIYLNSENRVISDEEERERERESNQVVSEVEVNEEDYLSFRRRWFGKKLFYKDGEFWFEPDEDAKPEEQYFGFEIDSFHYQRYLESTDYIVQKINEASITDDEELVKELKEKYATEIQKRKYARKMLNKIDEIVKTLPKIESQNREVE